MSWMQKLCEVYNSVTGTAGAEGQSPLLPVGFIQKTIKYNIILSPTGQFVTAQVVPRESQLCAVPTTPQAEGRTTDNGPPFPLAEQLKYLLIDGSAENPRFESYLRQLTSWCESADAPQCLRTLLAYLEKRTLCDDLTSVPELKLKYHKDETEKDGKGADAKSIACFSIEYPDEENRLWMRHDVRNSWSHRYSTLFGGNSALCYVTGEQLPVMSVYPVLLGRAKLISSEDTGFPFRYKGRFIADGSAASASTLASVKAHNALKWLLEHQGFHRFGMYFVGWNVDCPPLPAPSISDDWASNGEPEEDDDWSPDEEPDAQEAAKRQPDTLEAYVNALLRAMGGNADTQQRMAESNDRPDAYEDRIANVVLLGLQAATPGRMSITYYQEMPGNQLVERVNAWHRDMHWKMPDKQRPDRAPKWLEICEAVIGADAVQTARGDFKADKSATKLMREMQLRLLHCTVNGAALPHDMVHSAFVRAVSPLSFTDAKGKWQGFKWAQCMATACAMIRKHLLDQPQPIEITPALDPALRSRDYLYGRLLAVAHRLEQAASRQPEEKLNSIQMMAQLVQRPYDTWPKLYIKLIPYLTRIGDQARSAGEPEGRQKSARMYLHLLGQIESLFRPEDRTDARPLSYLFLAGYSAQSRSFQSAGGPLPFLPPQTRDELYGCLLAVADDCEWNAERLDNGSSSRDGRTNALLMTGAFVASPSRTWQQIHDRLIPYLEKSGVRTARQTQRLLRRIEQGFAPGERLSGKPLGGLFLLGYLCMTLALMDRTLDPEAWQTTGRMQAEPDSREAAFGALLALENDVERRALDLDPSGGDSRSSNAMRFLPRAAQRPSEVWTYLRERLRPYEKKLWMAGHIRQEIDALHARIEENSWNTDEPLRPEYLHFFYLYSDNDHRKDD